MKKFTFFLVATFVLVFQIFLSPAKADVGPKPGVIFDFKGLEGEDFYGTLLSKTDSTGPYSVEREFSEHKKEEANGFNKFKEIRDKDGYYYLGFIEKLEGNERLHWSYYPPHEFKLCLYFPDRDLVLISEKKEDYAFNSYFTADFRNFSLEDKSGTYYFTSDEVNTYRSYNYFKEIVSLILRIILTIAIEYGLALLMFNPSPYQKKLIIRTNIFTQILLNIGLNIILYLSGFLAFFLIFIPAEIVVFIVEAGIYKARLNKDKKEGDKKAPAILYALLANILSAFIGYYQAMYFTFFF